MSTGETDMGAYFADVYSRLQPGAGEGTACARARLAAPVDCQPLARADCRLPPVCLAADCGRPPAA